MQIKETIFMMFAIFLVSSIINIGQDIPNGGFENWSGVNIDDWTHNSLASVPTVVKTTDSFEGSSAVKGVVFDFLGTPFPPTLFIGTHQTPTFPISENPKSLLGNYKFNSDGGDVLFIEVIILNLSEGGGGEGHVEITNNASSYESLDIPIVYDDNNPPGWKATHASINVIIKPASGQIPHIGTEYILDNFSFDTVTDLEIIEENLPTEYSLKQNYPNPFNPSTQISVNVPNSGEYNLTIYNTLGSKVVTLLNGNLSSGTHSFKFNAPNLTSGLYFYNFQGKGINETKKMILMK